MEHALPKDAAAEARLTKRLEAAMALLQRTQQRGAKQAAKAADLERAVHDARLRAKERAPAPLRVGGGTKCEQCRGGGPALNCSRFACSPTCCAKLRLRPQGPSSCSRHDKRS